MASLPCLVYFSLTLLFFLQGALGASRDDIVACASLDSSTCAFAVSSFGTRCVLEKRLRRRGQTEELICRTWDIVAENLSNFVETDECIQACGLNRSTIGISSDALFEDHFTQKLCSSQCYKGCPNIVDLYFNLAAGEGVFLPKLCEVQAIRASLAEVRRSGAGPAAGGPESGSDQKVACGPTAESGMPAMPPL